MSSAKRTTAIALAFALAGTGLPGAALAQSQQDTGQQGAAPATSGGSAASGAAMHELEDDRTDVTWYGMTLDRLEDMDVRNAAGEQIGEVEDILGDAQDKVVGFVVEAGGFLGIGGEEVVVPVDRAQLGDNGQALVVDMSADEMRSLERWKD